MNARFRWLWASAGLANLGDGITITALPLIALAAGAQPGEVALVTASATIAWPLFGLHAGWVADRLSPHLLLAMVNGARAASLLALTVAISLDSSVFAMTLATAFVFGTAETLVDTALIAGIPRIVDRRDLTAANARIEATINVNNQLAGPPLAGLLIGTTGILAASSSGGLYAFAALAAIGLMCAAQRSAPAPTRASRRSHHTPMKVREGTLYLWSHQLQRELTLLTAGMSLVWGAWSATFVLHAVSPGPLGLDTATYGILLTGMAAGGILASIFTERLQVRLSSTWLLFIDTVGTLGLALPSALNAPLPVIAIGIIVAGAGSTVWRIIVAVIRQQATPLRLIGRVYSASRVISWGALPLGASLGAVGVQTLGLPPLFWIESLVAMGICAWFAIRMPAIRMRIDQAADETPSELIQPNG